MSAMRRLRAAFPTALIFAAILAGILAAALAAIVVFGAVSSARADEGTPTWSVQPGSGDGPDGRSAIEATVDAGATVEDTVVITNHTDFAVTYGLYAADAQNNTQDGTFALIESPEQNADLGAWITFAADSSQSPCNEVPLPEGCPPLPPGATALTLGAGETVAIPVTINVPHDAASGDHAAGLVASWYNASTGGDGQPLTLEQRVGARVYLRVNGELNYQAAVNGLTGGYTQSWNPFSGAATVRYHLENVGNVRLHVDQVVVLTGPFDIELGRSAPMRAEHLNPGQRIAVNETFTGIAPLFALDATVHAVAVGADGVEAPVLEQGTTVWALPWLLFLLIAAAAGLVWWVRFRRRRHQERLALTIEIARAEALAQAQANAQAKAQAHTPREPELIAVGPPARGHRNGGGEQ